MKWKLWVSNLSVSGPRVAVRTQLPWPLRALLAFIALSLAFAAGLASSEIVRGFGRTERAEQGAELDRLRSQLAQALADRDREAAAAVNWESRLKVERSAQEQVRVQVKMLEDENARLKGDLAFFESLLPMPVDAKGVVIRSFRVQADSRAQLAAVSPAGAAERETRARLRRRGDLDDQPAGRRSTRGPAVARSGDAQRGPRAAVIPALSAAGG